MTINLHRIETVLLDNGRVCDVEIMAVAPHRGPWRDSVLDLKYHAHTRRARDLAHEMNLCLVHTCSIDAVTWIPTTDRRRRDRGFDQAELIARHLASLRSGSAKRLLRRVGNSHQAGMSRESRLARPRFIAHPHCEGLVVLVVDDVTTTGATFREAARTLLQAGASGVVCCSATYAPFDSKEHVPGRERRASQKPVAGDIADG